MIQQQQLQVIISESDAPYGLRRVYDGGAPDLVYVEYVAPARIAAPAKATSTWMRLALIRRALAWIANTLIQIAIAVWLGG